MPDNCEQNGPRCDTGLASRGVITRSVCHMLATLHTVQGLECESSNIWCERCSPTKNGLHFSISETVGGDPNFGHPSNCQTRMFSSRAPAGDMSHRWLAPLGLFLLTKIVANFEEKFMVSNSKTIPMCPTVESQIVYRTATHSKGISSAKFLNLF